MRTLATLVKVGEPVASMTSVDCSFLPLTTDFEMHIHDTRETLSVVNCDLPQSSFVNAGLSKSTFDDVSLQGAAFTNINLADATFSDVNFTGSSIVNANMTGMTINGAPVYDMLRAYERGTDHGHSGAVAAPTVQAGAVLYTSTIGRLRTFYEVVGHLVVERIEEDHVVLASPAFQLVLVRARSNETPLSVDTAPSARSRASVKLAFIVPSIESARAIAADLGGEVLPREREWDFQGTRVCDATDPEGNIIQLREILQTKAACH